MEKHPTPPTPPRAVVKGFVDGESGFVESDGERDKYGLSAMEKSASFYDGEMDKSTLEKVERGLDIGEAVEFSTTTPSSLVKEKTEKTLQALRKDASTIRSKMKAVKEGRLKAKMETLEHNLAIIEADIKKREASIKHG